MHTAPALLDIHERVHRNFADLLVHCRDLSAADIDRKHDGFGYASVRLQIHHVIGAEKYWIGVLEGRVDAEEDDPLYPTIESLERYREQVFAATERHLRGTTDDILNTRRTVATWGGRQREVIPAQVVLRTQVHVYHHMGQVTAMCRLLGRPAEGVDYPID